jgi:putative hydrolase of the HAD superfamily
MDGVFDSTGMGRIVSLKFLYFDLGMVLLNFSVERMCRQMAEVAGVGATEISQVLFEGDLHRRYERGEISSRQFYDAFCRETGTCPDYDRLASAASDIFELNGSIVPVVAQLHQARYRLGVLSNTCENHWTYCLQRFALLHETFSVFALSYELHAMKPGAAIFHAAAQLAGVRPEEIFFCDDIAGHVAGARAVGIDAVQYTSTPELVGELRKRGLRFNY